MKFKTSYVLAVRTVYEHQPLCLCSRDNNGVISRHENRGSVLQKSELFNCHHCPA